MPNRFEKQINQLMNFHNITRSEAQEILVDACTIIPGTSLLDAQKTIATARREYFPHITQLDIDRHTRLMNTLTRDAIYGKTI